MSKTTSQDIQATLWKAAGTFRGTIDAANYKDFVLSMLFLKYLDDTYKEFLRELEENTREIRSVSTALRRTFRSSLVKKSALITCMVIASTPKSAR